MNRSLLLSSLIALLATSLSAATNTYADSGVSAAAKKKAGISKKLKQGGLRSLPQTSKMVAKGGKKGSSKSHASGVGVLVNAPAVPEIPGEDITNLFWRDGVIDRLIAGTPTNEDCNEFFSSTTNGESGGMLACYGTSEAGRTFEQLQQSATSICYLRNAPNASSGVELVSGTLPAGGLKAVFAPPPSGSRLVKVEVSDPERGTQEIFIRVFAQSSSVAYRHQISFCDGSEASEGEELSVSTGGQYRSSFIGVHQEGEESAAFTSEVSAFLTTGNNGQVQFDLTRPRTIGSAYEQGVRSFASQTALNGQFVRTKMYDNFGDDVRRAFGVNKVSGNDLATLRVLELAYKDQNFDGSASFDEGDGRYLVDNNSSVANQLGSVDLDTDSFYSEDHAIDLTALDDYSCADEPDVVISMDMSDEALIPVAQECEGLRLDGMDYCRNEQIEQAQAGFFAHCMGGGGPGEGQ